LPAAENVNTRITTIGMTSTGSMFKGKIEKLPICPLIDQTLTNNVQTISPTKKNEMNLVFLEEDHSVFLTPFLISRNNKAKLPNVKRINPALINECCIAQLIFVLMYG
jgi:hypothetical protein